VGVDETVSHTVDAVALDESDASHVGRKVKNSADSAARGSTFLPLAQIETEGLGFGGKLVPLTERLLIDGPDGATLRAEAMDQVPADEAPGPRYEREVFSHADGSFQGWTHTGPGSAGVGLVGVRAGQ
jgi:hypothetical protein